MNVRKARHPWSRGGEAGGGNAEELGAGSGQGCVCTCLSLEESGTELRNREWSLIASFTSSSWAFRREVLSDYCPRGTPNSCVHGVVPHGDDII